MTRSPTTSPSPGLARAPRPGRSPPRPAPAAPATPTSSPNARHRVDDLQPARTARSASSSRATGTPQTAITASPMNFSTRAAVAVDDRARGLEVAAQQLAHVLGVARTPTATCSRRGRRTAPTPGAARARTSGTGGRAAAAAGASARAALVAELLAGGVRAPQHDGQRRSCEAPHSMQNFDCSGTSLPQLRQITLHPSGRGTASVAWLLTAPPGFVRSGQSWRSAISSSNRRSGSSSADPNSSRRRRSR